MDRVYKKIEKYLHTRFPHKMILRAGKKERIPEIEEIYGVNGIIISVYEIGKKVYYKFNRRN